MFSNKLRDMTKMDAKNFKDASLKDFKWFNEPKTWKLIGDVLEVTTNENTDFWHGAIDNICANTGHLYGVDITDDFAISVVVEGEYTQLYDQAGLMLYVDENHWMKAGIEFNEEQPMISSVVTNGQASDWATGIYPGNPQKFHLRVSRKSNAISVKYSTDGSKWSLIRTCAFPSGLCKVGLMCCTPKRGGLEIKFSDVKLRDPEADIVHGN